MSSSWQTLFARVDQVQFREASERLRKLIDTNGVALQTATPVIGSAYEAWHLWNVRHKNSESNGLLIPGLDILLERLGHMPPRAQIEQFGFTGDKLAGCIFFDHQTGEFLGDTIVERRPKSQAMLDLEAELGITPHSHPHRKTA